MSFVLLTAMWFTLCTPSLFHPPLIWIPRTAGNGEEEILPPCNLQVFTYTCDVGKRENVYLTAERVRKEVGEVSVLVNNAGVVSGHHLLECPDELIERTMMVNCHAHFWVNMNVFVFIPGSSVRRLGRTDLCAIMKATCTPPHLMSCSPRVWWVF